MRSLRYAIAVIAIAVASQPAGAAEKGADHPLVGRFQGAEITNYERRNFDAYPLIVSRVENYGGIGKNADSTRSIEGRVTHITYRSAKEHSTLEVFRAYQDALADGGFEVLFKCEGVDCGGRDFNHAASGYRFSPGAFAENHKEQRYLAARLARAQGDVYVAIHTARNTSSGGVNKDAVYTQVDVVERKARESEVVVVKAGEMAESLGAEGKVALYGIHFDTDSAKVRPESGPTLAEIGKLLKSRPGLKLLVVGHTDNQGGFDYNIDLSKRRAAAVVEALASDYGVAKARLRPWGVGFAAPAATNATEEGRAENRRVELVLR